MKRLLRQLLRVTGALLGAIGALILLEIVIQALGGGSHPIANWAVVKLDKIFRPVGRWFISAPDWAWISVTMVLGFPAAILLTWALDVASIGIKPTHKPRWIAGVWIIVVTLTCASLRWAKVGSGF